MNKFQSRYTGDEIDSTISAVRNMPIMEIAHHIQNKQNPHGVTATQIGAISESGGTPGDVPIMQDNGHIKWEKMQSNTFIVIADKLVNGKANLTSTAILQKLNNKNAILFITDKKQVFNYAGSFKFPAGDKVFFYRNTPVIPLYGGTSISQKMQLVSIDHIGNVIQENELEPLSKPEVIWEDNRPPSEIDIAEYTLDWTKYNAVLMYFNYGSAVILEKDKQENGVSQQLTLHPEPTLFIRDVGIVSSGIRVDRCMQLYPPKTPTVYNSKYCIPTGCYKLW